MKEQKIDLKEMNRDNNQGEIVIYQTDDGDTKIDVRFVDETVWLTQAQLCELYQTSKSNVSEHIKNIFEEGELEENSVVRKCRTTASDGKNYNVSYYNLDMIISLGYRIKSISYFSEISGKWKSKYNEYQTNITDITNKFEIHIIRREKWHRLQKFVINIYDKQIEFVSIGGLLPCLTANDIRSGISQPRNKNLAEVFHRLKLIEAYGTGIRRIYRLYENCSVQPLIEVTHNTFKMILPNMNTVDTLKHTTYLMLQKEKILDFISKKGQITESGIMELLGVKRRRAYTVAKQMSDESLIVAIGRGANKNI